MNAGLNQYHDGYAKMLFWSIIIGLLPIVLVSVALPSLFETFLYQILVGSMFGVQVLVITIYFISATEKKIDWRYVAFGLIFSLFQLITILRSSIVSSINFFDIINVISRFLSVFLLLCIPAGLKISKDAFNRFMLSIVILSVIACFYNFIVNFSDIMKILTFNNPFTLNFSSFYFNRNTFGQLLFISIIACTFLWVQKNSRFLLFAYVFFFINLIITLSRTATASALIFLCVLMFVFLKKKIKPSHIVLAVSFTAVIVIALTNKKIIFFIVGMLIRSDVGMSDRDNLWLTGFEILNQNSWLLGIGYLSGVNIIKELGFNLKEFHSFYVETLIGGGLADLIMHFGLFGYTLNRIIHIRSFDKDPSSVYFSAYIALFVYMTFESASFFTMGYVGTLFTAFFITMPVLYSNRALEKPGVSSSSLRK
ncbi:MAG TPA: O-antigen ligase family protein [Clostridiales bacterium]|nr:O-antigen ligase family protein [Clostridiales bacterium]HQP71002.1 O-antigen ligase family protein [Clostridiales bacterium]